MHAFLIAGTNSGVGKTTITLSLISALKSLNFFIQPFKVGPDFIDPGYHKMASNNVSINLDSWMLSQEYNIYNFYKFMDNKDIGIVEGVMGFYDGFSATSNKGSSAEIAKFLNLPVILIVNGKSMARSAAAIVYGFENFDKDINIVGVIFNNVSGENHYSYLKESLLKYCKAIPLGYFQSNDFHPLPSRHLGLVTVEDNKEIKNFLKEYGDIAKKRININRLLEITKYNIKDKVYNFSIKKIKKIKIAVAKDNAFCFYYYDNLRILKELGGEIVYFSPLKDKNLPSNISFLYLGGGYPELYAKELSQNITMLKSIKNFSDKEGFIYAECGGFMYLTEGIYNPKGKFFPLVGIFNDKAIMNDKLRTLGYAEITTISDNFFGKKGISAKGHEFHYSYLKNNGNSLTKIYQVTMRNKKIIKSEGYIYKNTLGSYIHLHFGSNPHLIENLYLRIST